MNAMAITRESGHESIEEQRLRIMAFASFLGIHITDWHLLTEDNYGDIYENLSKITAVIVTNLSLISKEIATLDEFKMILHYNSVKLISMYS
ncbi:hypothetical protein [Paenibacillus glycanilyticus]|uniref:hypothetical protein n=1 Tax=Paenibacillus glycanilyticus TaxID=126569 RepID=UPI000FD90FEA|nr:hypothetical protein [Paenibacillus glycanilyticus]